jgi:glycosyltransferase involved in cell wall biosynthesis
LKILVLASNYPNTARPLAAAFNEKSVAALRGLCEQVTVLAPRPYTPPLFSSLKARWRTYSEIPSHEIRNGVQVYRPAYLQFPGMPTSFSIDGSAFLWCRRVAKRMHKRIGFDVILSFDLLGAGALAWKLGRDLGIPAAGWATGDDVRVKSSSSQGKAVIRAINRLDLVFYQCQELKKVVIDSLGISQSQLPDDRHIVLSRGVSPPPLLPRNEIRNRLRNDWGISDNDLLIMNIGRIAREKGIFELIQAISMAVDQDPRIRCVVIGSDPVFDDSNCVKQWLAKTPVLAEKLKLLPACNPEQVWEYLCAADVFAFTSYREGMPNSLLEAMAMGLPAIAFAIPPVLEIEAGTGALLTVPFGDSRAFAEAILRLVDSPLARLRIGDRGRAVAMQRYMVTNNMAIAFQQLTRVQSLSREGTCASPQTH